IAGVFGLDLRLAPIEPGDRATTTRAAAAADHLVWLVIGHGVISGQFLARPDVAQRDGFPLICLASNGWGTARPRPDSSRICSVLYAPDLPISQTQTSTSAVRAPPASPVFGTPRGSINSNLTSRSA